MWTNRWMDRQTDEKRTNKHTEFHQFRKEPELQISYLSDDGQTDEKQTNEHTEFHQFRKEPSYDGDLKFEFENRFKVRVRKRKMWTDRRTDRQTDVGHINLIGGLVTRNPPKNN